MKHKFLLKISMMLLIASMVLAACGSNTTPTVEPSALTEEIQPVVELTTTPKPAVEPVFTATVPPTATLEPDPETRNNILRDNLYIIVDDNGEIFVATQARMKAGFWTDGRIVEKAGLPDAEKANTPDGVQYVFHYNNDHQEWEGWKWTHDGSALQISMKFGEQEEDPWVSLSACSTDTLCNGKFVTFMMNGNSVPQSWENVLKATVTDETLVSAIETWFDRSKAEEVCSIHGHDVSEAQWCKH